VHHHLTLLIKPLYCGEVDAKQWHSLFAAQ
jgi:hypothetical protein